MAPDTISSLFPDRPIRPLPKRRLRERLSPQVADSIQYPPVPRATLPPPRNPPTLFYHSYSFRVDDPEQIIPATRDKIAQLNLNSPRRSYSHESDEDEAAGNSQAPVTSRQFSDPPRLDRQSPKRTDIGRHPSSQPPNSATSSVDGYDSFENTNNKKKRKIPSAGDSTLNGVHGLSDEGTAATTPLAHSPTESSIFTTSSPYHISGAFSAMPGMSGPGRGRFGRVKNMRSPLHALSDSSGNWVGRTGKIRSALWESTQARPGTGIISNAIANAEKLPVHSGQENVSLLQQLPKSKSTESPMAFTFTCHVPTKTHFPAEALPHHTFPVADGGDGGTGGRRMADAWRNSHATTRIGSASSPAAHRLGMNSAGAMPHVNGPAHAGGVNADVSGTSQSRQARLSARQYQIAAEQRRRKTLEENRKHPPKDEDIWICYFCEYEAIYGRPPVALIRQYEKKALRARQEEENRRRLLEKAKARSRKGKKSNKLASKNAAAPVQDKAPGQGGHDVPPPSHDDAHPDGLHHDEYVEEEDDEDDDYVVVEDEYEDEDDEHDPILSARPIRPGESHIRTNDPGGPTAKL